MGNNNLFSWNAFHKAPIVGILRGLEAPVIYAIVDTYKKAGLTTIEITMNTPNATHIIEKLRANYPDLNIGAGTVCSLEDFNSAVAAGAQFIVTPIVDTDVIKRSVDNEIPIFPGAYTPTEIYTAYKLGASAVKVFPATQLGPQYLKDVLAPLDQINLLPTGGVTKENIRTFFNVGAVGVGMGSSLMDKEHIADNNYKGLQDHFEKVLDEIQDFT